MKHCMENFIFGICRGRGLRGNVNSLLDKVVFDPFVICNGPNRNFMPTCNHVDKWVETFRSQKICWNVDKLPY